VVSVERSPGRRELARSSGLSTVVAPEDAGAAVAPSGANLVLECSGSQLAVLLATEMCALHGEVMVVGAPWRDEPDVAASSVVARVFERFLSLRSGWEWQVPLYGEERSVAGCTRWVLDRLADGSVSTAPLVSGTVTPDQAHAVRCARQRARAQLHVPRRLGGRIAPATSLSAETAPRRRRRRVPWGAYLALVLTLGLLGFFAYDPDINGPVRSLTNWEPGFSSPFVGLANYRAMWHDGL
jgi:hypothetical protein